MKKPYISLGRWLVYVKYALISTNHFNEDVRPDTKSWSVWYHEGMPANKAVELETGLQVPFYFASPISRFYND